MKTENKLNNKFDVMQKDFIIKFYSGSDIITGIVMKANKYDMTIKAMNAKIYSSVKYDSFIKIVGRVYNKPNHKLNEWDSHGYGNPELKDSIEFEKYRQEQKIK